MDQTKTTKVSPFRIIRRKLYPKDPDRGNLGRFRLTHLVLILIFALP